MHKKQKSRKCVEAQWKSAHEVKVLQSRQFADSDKRRRENLGTLEQRVQSQNCNKFVCSRRMVFRKCCQVNKKRGNEY